MSRVLDMGKFAPDDDGPIRSAATIVNQRYGPVRWLVRGIIPCEGVSMIVAPPKAGKSIFIMNIAISNCLPDRILDYREAPDRSLDILYLDLESTGRRTQYRISGILGNRPIPNHLLIADKWDRFGEGGDVELRHWLDGNPCDMVIIDTLGRIQAATPGTQSTSYALDHRKIETFQNISSEYDVGILLVHHTRKATAEDWVDMVSGSNGISGTLDTVMFLSRKRGATNGILHVTGRDVEEEAYVVAADFGTFRWRIKGTLDEVNSGLTENRQLIMNCLRGHKGELSPAEISNMTGQTIDSVKYHLANLFALGAILRPNYGKYVERNQWGL